MSLSKKALDALQNHWAVNAIGAADLTRAKRLVSERLAQRAVGGQIAFSFSWSENHDTLLERVALAFEMAAIEGLEELSRPSGEDIELRDQATAASFCAFDIRRLLQVPAEKHDRLSFVLQLSAVAYCGDRWSDLRRWYKENEPALKPPSVAGTPWTAACCIDSLTAGSGCFASAGGTILTGSQRSSPDCARIRSASRKGVSRTARSRRIGQSP